MIIKTLVAASILVCGVAMAAPPQGDVLLMDQVQKEKTLNLPSRGLTMAQVEAQYGAPLKKLPTRGGDAPLHPPINRWVYDDYIVYFERKRVIHAVINPPAQDSKG